jgi:serine-type D-Ala-D-Ala carboxypeptidase (penicillin-binding protein 5/6)
MIPSLMLRFVVLAGLLLPGFLAAQAPESVMVVEAHSGKILFATNSSVKRPVASLTKIATAAVTIDWALATNTDLGKTMVTAPQTVALVGGPNPMDLQPGDRLSLRDALYSALLGSDNLAALTIADHVGRELLARRGKRGDPVGEFVSEMNQLGRIIGLTQTLFVNPHGLDTRNTKGHSTAADVARLSIYAMRRNAFSFIVRQPDRQVTVNGSRTYRVKNTNELLSQTGVLGIKTGTTAAAGPCLATCIDRDPLLRTLPDGTKAVTPRRLIVVVLNSPDRFTRTRGLITQGWATYDSWMRAGAPIENPVREILRVVPPER